MNRGLDFLYAECILNKLLNKNEVLYNKEWLLDLVFKKIFDKEKVFNISDLKSDMDNMNMEIAKINRDNYRKESVESVEF